MRLHRLTASAFGPFAGSIDLDLERLSDAGLFLVHGPTGSGKTSLLDAICFALYAQVPGDRVTTTLRSQHALEQMPTRVELELTLGERRLRVRRHPAHERPKRRGSGMTTQPAGVQLEELVAGRWTTLSTRIDETAQVLDDLLGMGLDQFRRVVMLPQGDFAAFLRASDEERRTVLERLFDITDYTGVETHLVDRRQRLDASVAQDRAHLAGHVAHLVEQLSSSPLSLPEPELPWADLSPTALLTAVDSVAEACTLAVTRVMAQGSQARAVDAAAAAAHDHGRRVQEHRRRGRRAQADLAQLEAGAPEHRARTAALRRARAAAGVLPLVQACDRAARLLASAEADVEHAVLGLPEDLDLVGLGSPDEVDLPAELVQPGEQASGWLARSRAQDLTLTRAGLEAEALQRLSLEVPQVEAAAERQAEMVIEAQAQVTRARELLSRAVTDEAAMSTAAERLAVVNERVRTLADVIAARARLRDAQEQLRERIDLEQAGRDDALDARARVQELVAARLTNMAGELAARLEDGHECVVCGATEHPQPARSARVVTQDELDAAESSARAAEGVHREASTQRSESASRVELLRDGITDLAERAQDEQHRDLGDEQAELELHQSLTSEAMALRQATGDAATAQVRTQEAATALEDAQATLQRVTADVSSATARGEQVQADMVAGHGRLVAALDEHAASCPCSPPADPDTDVPPTPTSDGTLTTDDPAEDLRDGLAHLDRLRRSVTDRHRRAQRAVEALVTAATQRARCASDAAAAQERMDRAMAEHEFPDPGAVQAATLERAALQVLQSEVDEYERRATTTRSVLEDPAVISALTAEAPDLDHLAERARAARAASDQAHRAEATAEASQRHLDRVGQHVRAACIGLGPAIEEAALVHRLADLVTGTSSDNDKRMRLSTYVLAARLERIVTLANDRLGSMADGRYELVHDDASARGQRRGGLGLLVRDLWTGRERPTSTLSGGESFTTALALALGLADAIREESGGQEFGTLFVDEGFGSLDEDSLEQVLDVLDELRGGGRAVGLVSHVSEMRTRITTQVRVDKTPHGSSIHLVDAGVEVDPGSTHVA